ncbi:hypothetical protein SEA_BOGOTA_76 [Streptomyces phage Bogota]|jgi:hypothetical protein|nr:hypothetical protein SEA_UNTPL_76 [Streptomyces phage UNTPL]WIC89226.1 hypothetical protein SEA_BOGOTA_76 [Streptomyces phage Bogota]
MAWCQNPKCGDEFDPTEVSDETFCSWDCLEATCGDCGGSMTNGVCDDEGCISHDYDEDED